MFGEATERIKPELFESFVEITTTVVETAEEAEAQLRALRNEVAEQAAAHGLTVLATGSHPTARGRVPLVRRMIEPRLVDQTLHHQEQEGSEPEASHRRDQE